MRQDAHYSIFLFLLLCFASKLQSKAGLEPAQVLLTLHGSKLAQNCYPVNKWFGSNLFLKKK